MLEWANKSHEIILRLTNIQKKDIHEAICEQLDLQKTLLRNHMSIFFNIIKKYQIPLLIFSAGIKDVLEVVLYHSMKENVFEYDNIHVLSNAIQYDENLFVSSFSQPTLHVLNKKINDFYIETSYFYLNQNENDNIIVIGDSLGDVNMIQNIKYKNCLKIGFLNDNIQQRMNQYLDAYDIVIIGDINNTIDPGFEFHQYILQCIIEYKYCSFDEQKKWFSCNM